MNDGTEAPDGPLSGCGTFSDTTNGFTPDKPRLVQANATFNSGGGTSGHPNRGRYSPYTRIAAASTRT
ncbi:hypothetical protein ACJ6WF_11880 [Streptomyces sp. MMS24-I2-30]|uniref:hypothetical protein n=1 Tax=Streptomyces sp. MMS24-I2-30 TaxID=3351564 RepID=UPI003896A3F1